MCHQGLAQEIVREIHQVLREICVKTFHELKEIRVAAIQTDQMRDHKNTQTEAEPPKDLEEEQLPKDFKEE